ncbi:hypothetical protein RSA37_11750 [Mammaliicoccus sciuri]|uniref:DUF1024 family protein n=1 Tax=Mammaliicoccus sciuri TaxID=1296 RepID=UPI0007347397|nr:DUF1024 family protein [Mammaliicoccus sciuri]KTT82704.1 hypothetical protein NS1R_12010 [Mammaliicoccus sciuri]KTT88239.1 hypothetical protein NS112_09480 [Mammaliicoccus sciuri]KTT89782.1 hypothetical protein NS36R_08005 [Mammaliicoccus sciuri]KTT94174.1 hypothetical protein NS44R_08420 [Mammaliicoccus sciuri]KTW10720.1 hypothetical protein RSA37_11750 [Mammaliicoccus sciuri]
MEYKYENTVVAELTSLGMEYNSNAHYEMADEVEEVYAKAKAFDEISQVFKKVTIYNTATALEVKEILDNLEDK